jgi:hypothetical protein
MTRWFRFYDGALDDPKVQALPGDLFKAALIAAMNGEGNCFSPYIKPDRDRSSGPIWEALRRAVFKRDNYTCKYCGLRAGQLECDHVMPVSRGGTDDPSNLVAACVPCNRSKRDQTPEEWKGV